MREYKGVTFNGKHSWRDYELKPVKFSTPLPAQRTVKQEVPGMHGSLDVSEALTGYVLYENRTLEFVFDLRAHTQEEFEEKMFVIRNDLDSVKGNVILDTDSDYYYVGRFTVSGEYQQEEIDHEIVIAADAEPFKYKTEVTLVKTAVSGAKTVVCMNDRMEAVPSIKSSSECTVFFRGNSYGIPGGISMIPDIVFRRGENFLRLEGNAEIEITYQEGAL